MNIFSDPQLDVRSEKPNPGSYEWWYFDAISLDETYSFVIIFYEGNPFSTRYIRALEDATKNPKAKAYPAVSVSIYEEGVPIYYSFTEFEEQRCSFRGDRPMLKIGRHKMNCNIDGNTLKYLLELEEELPSGDALRASIRFVSPIAEGPLFNGPKNDKTDGHQWNLVQPRAEAQGDIEILVKGEDSRQISFKGRGYHDHNMGYEPMRSEFKEWYWGRFHFDEYTLVYYMMNRQQNEQHCAWLINRENSKVAEVFEDIEPSDKGLTLFGLHTARKIILQSSKAEVHIQQSRLLDNGPFYRRYSSDAFLRIKHRGLVESKSGITEYIYPSRIYSSIFWPFVDMRIRYAAENPHWVQRSKTLYRWTW